MNIPEDVTDRVCQLECLKGRNVREFVGPVRILLVDPPPNEYCRKQWAAAFVQLANMMIGATFLIVLLFSLSFKLNVYNNLHVLLCSIGLQLCFPSGVLMCNELNGASVQLKIKDRIFQHLLLMSVGFVTAAVGGFLVYSLGKTSESKNSMHCFAGLGAIFFGFITLLIGPFNYFFSKYKPEKCFSGFCSKLHILFGVPCIIASALCFILGVLKPAFTNWVPLKDMFYAIIVCSVFYTLVIVYRPLRNFIHKKIVMPDRT